MTDPNTARRFHLVHRRACWVPTLWGWLVLALLLAGGLLAFALTIHPFLAMSNGVPRGALVVEGWATDAVLAAAMDEFQRHDYDRLYVTGGPIEEGAPLSEYKNYAARGAATLAALGIPPDRVQAVPAPAVTQDRTYASAVSLQQHLKEAGKIPRQLHLYTEGPHARRSRLLFDMAFEDEVSVTVTSVPTRAYDARRWWASSSGVRAVIGEVIAYVYVRVFFSP